MSVVFGKVGRSGNSIRIKGKFLWLGNPVGKLERLKSSTQRRIIMKAVRAGSRIMRDVLKKAPTPRRKQMGGALRAAMGLKVYRPKRKPQSIGVIGPRSKYERFIRFRTHGANKGKMVIHRPGKILHLLERGFTTRGGGRFKGLGFMQRAFQVAWPRARAEMFRIIGQEVNKELAKGK